MVRETAEAKMTSLAEGFTDVEGPIRVLPNMRTSGCSCDSTRQHVSTESMLDPITTSGGNAYTVHIVVRVLGRNQMRCDSHVLYGDSLACLDLASRLIQAGVRDMPSET